MTSLENPLVTFAVFTYNQQQFVAEAIQAALAQDYSPLEIIVSDDSSTDDTFEIIRELVSKYDGPHNISARQTTKNRGTLLHLAEVAGMARGELLVLAAGDDVSKVGRTKVLVDVWRNTNAWGLCSRFDSIDESGLVLRKSEASSVLQGHGFRDFFYDGEGPVRIVHGCTSAYDARIFEYLKLTADDYILSEDGALSVLLNLLGKSIVNLDESLVFYRESQNSLTNSRAKPRISYARIVEDEARIEWFAQAQANRCKLFLRMNEYLGVAQTRRMRVENVRSELARQVVRANWRKTSFAKRWAFMLSNPKSTWALPRMLGMHVFYAAKWLSGRLVGRV